MGYFIDASWNYREVLLGFEHLVEDHTGAHLAEVVMRVLQRHNLESSVYLITTDNASNNLTIADQLEVLLATSREY